MWTHFEILGTPAQKHPFVEDRISADRESITGPACNRYRGPKKATSTTRRRGMMHTGKHRLCTTTKAAGEIPSTPATQKYM